jgi:alpha-tubulin suppressor-like RCC1 family protein
MEDKQMRQISCGINHTLMLDEDGYAYASGASENG